MGPRGGPGGAAGLGGANNFGATWAPRRATAEGPQARYDRIARNPKSGRILPEVATGAGHRARSRASGRAREIRIFPIKGQVIKLTDVAFTARSGSLKGQVTNRGSSRSGLSVASRLLPGCTKMAGGFTAKRKNRDPPVTVLLLPPFNMRTAPCLAPPPVLTVSWVLLARCLTKSRSW